MQIDPSGPISFFTERAKANVLSTITTRDLKNEKPKKG
ncbi:MAG: hypothetical protein UW27_C0003G0038 [Parcubacteria group bacterium GW2011_GWA1_44_13]|uniref:Uncharacterized protein n=1 Tax=Candidatus Nomurabacteria bacterium GW2011_GWB1_44_12 TaxID=1618748 RepID=A0A837I6Y7_9BACT|nr:MAG: hypothetical protein UW17_C0028G0006 [Candidatus Nomurabacteria bacterium GW2011_GWD1_44_10]KKT36607.1 MAG: hypothetical protein UW25_C0005G0089 [Candidatus Nomurabacteria bacterium GW2011_GWB1_44_12]KKT38290.1 MAG: hypothetical protein UW27_C0003G0038 [Parcubacteria group bacterium GW2011_GWA1_44_13]KKT59651.1 MAG: hypothetical protein UW54_C0022G0008 [Parcubacteria group bacterium GW2011_GWC1_44_26]